MRRELELESVKGEPLILDLSLTAIHDGSGQVMQLLVDGRDLTVRKRAEDVLREVESLTTMGRLAASVAHEINNPLAGIQNSFLLVKDAIPRDAPASPLCRGDRARDRPHCGYYPAAVRDLPPGAGWRARHTPRSAPSSPMPSP